MKKNEKDFFFWIWNQLNKSILVWKRIPPINESVFDLWFVSACWIKVLSHEMLSRPIYRYFPRFCFKIFYRDTAKEKPPTSAIQNRQRKYRLTPETKRLLTSLAGVHFFKVNIKGFSLRLCATEHYMTLENSWLFTGILN